MAQNKNDLVFRKPEFNVIKSRKHFLKQKSGPPTVSSTGAKFYELKSLRKQFKVC